VAAVATVAAFVLTSVGRSPADGAVSSGPVAVWALGIAAGVIAFVGWASVFSEVAQHRAEGLRTAEPTQQTEPFV
jgi:hypothetical protein